MLAGDDRGAGMQKSRRFAGGSLHSSNAALRRLLDEAEHGLDLEEFLEAELAPFAAGAGLLVAAERRVHVAARAVDVHVAGADLGCDLAGVVDVARLHIA